MFQKKLLKHYGKISYMNTFKVKQNGLSSNRVMVMAWGHLRNKSYSNFTKFDTFDHLTSKQRYDNFLGTFPTIVKDLTENEEETNDPELNKYYSELLNYVVPLGKHLPAVVFLAAYEMLEKNLTEENIRLANIMGWILELLGACGFVTDDIIDRSTTRHGLPAWHTRADVGLQAINDAFLLEQSGFSLLKKHFSNHHCYLPSTELLHDMSFKTFAGQALDVKGTTNNGQPNLQALTVDRYENICLHKTGYFNIFLPTTLAGYMANLYDVKIHKKTKKVFKAMSSFIQMQNDILDVWGDPNKTGKIGTDVQEGKCTWLSVMALQKANSAQRKVMESYFGRPDRESVNKIISLYEEMDLLKLYGSTTDALRKKAKEEIIPDFSNDERVQSMLVKLIEDIYHIKWKQ